MKSKSKTILAALVAVFALGAVAASSASAALPELVNKNGTELTYPFFTVNAGPLAYLEGTLKSGATECSSTHIIGVVTGPKTSKLVITYSGCTEGGTIKTLPLLGKLVYLNEKHTEVGWQLEPAEKNGPFLTYIYHKVGVKEAGKGGMDTLLARIKAPYNVKTTELTPELQCAFGNQQFTSYWEGATKFPGYLESYTVDLQTGKSQWENFCIKAHENELHLNFEEEVELKA